MYLSRWGMRLTEITKGGIDKEELGFLNEICQIVRSARSKAYSAINFAQVEANWLIGKRIVEQEQKGESRAEYGKQVITLVAGALSAEFGKGYSKTNIRNFRKFFLTFSDLSIQQAVPAKSDVAIQQAPPALLSWTHYERLMRVTNEDARLWYLKEAVEQMWSYRTLDRNIGTQYYERLLLSQVKDGVVEEMKQKTALFQNNKLEFIKNPTVLEFLGLPQNSGYREQDIEKAILSNLQKFLMELGKGFAFVARQQLIRTETEDYFIDLTFYNYILKCFVLIDLKIGRITHQDVGQMDMYVRMFDDLKRGKDDNPTIGIVLCSDTDENIARYSVLKGSEQLFATKYQLYLPSAKELQHEIERQAAIVKLQFTTGGHADE